MKIYRWLIAGIFVFAGVWPARGQELPKLPPSPLPEVGWTPFWVSEGFRLGYILDINYTWDSWPVWAYEGAFRMGTSTASGSIMDQYCMKSAHSKAATMRDEVSRQKIIDEAEDKCILFNNPIRFSFFDQKLFQSALALGRNSQLVVIHYGVPLMTFWGHFTQTSDWLYGIYPLNPDGDLPKEFDLPESLFSISRHLHPNAGTIVGRVVKASVDHGVFKTYEVIVQSGTNDNEFMAMSVSSRPLFDYITRAMLTGKMLNIKFVRMFNWEGSIIDTVWPYNTNYRVIGVRIAD